MIATQDSCRCGTATDERTQAPAPCACGCCQPEPATTQDKISELRAQRKAIDEQLAELENA
jgi:hypothetical protein